MTDTEIAALLRALAEQQTALLSAHAASMRVQAALIERLTSPGALGSPPECAPTETKTTTNKRAEDHLVVESVAPGAARDSSDRLDPLAEVSVDTGAEPEPVAAEPTAVVDEVGGQRAVLQRVGGTGPGRSERYYRSAARLQPSPVNVSPQQLNVLRAIHSAGDLGHLVVMFGPHAGETLGQIAQNDLEYLRELARTAQRADVRAAAARLVAAVPSDPPVHRKPNGQRSRRGR